ncbi:HNH endonuclease [Paraburkholderia panacisoli]|uniref:HNH endonuclease n=1 Tax=Paraburkholderia panacisoli TaxID=2603818 RepID=A0A5B0HDJ8_9BURK|nr:HNH endonuclease [Paraburkholderia panacisoli]KAA1013054.1 HNH endonuclease [Paraburkholderia panacisoli]
MPIVRHLIDAAQGKHPVTSARSNHWPAVREQHLKSQPVCVVCGGKDKLQVHHIRPFHLHPDLELDPNNLVTLCESGKGGVSCHLFVGHLSNFRGWNPNVKEDAETWKKKLAENKERIQNHQQE